MFLVFNIKTYNLENLNNYEERCIICGNHLSTLDAVLLAVCCKRQVHFMGKKELFENKFLNFIFRKIGAFPVDREGVSLSAIKTSLSILNNDGILGIFPEGTRISTGYDEENAKPGIALISYKSKSKVVLCHIIGEYKFRSKVKVYFSEPKDYFENYDCKMNTQIYTEIGKQILKDIYSLGEI